MPPTPAPASAPAPALPWLAALKKRATYPHPVGRIEILHTHLSVIALTGEFAYKFKKPVNYGFADFSTLARREQFCRAERDLNRRFAPDLYLGVVSLVETAKGWKLRLTPPRPDQFGPATEPAVQMRQFAAGDRFDEIVARGALTPDLTAALADTVAAMHQAIAPADPAIAQTYPGRLAQAIQENFAHLPAAPALTALRASFDQALAAARPLLTERAQQGQVRDCHGDLHLANLCLWNGRPTPFDCIEFNADLRVIDVLSDAAFLYMDLCARQQAPAAQTVLNRYLEQTGDYAGLPAWPLWVAYRATVRAKIAHLTCTAPGVPPADRAALETQREAYLALAAAALTPRTAPFVLMVGLPGSGKSTEALKRLPGGDGHPPGVRVRSDVERNRLFPAPQAPEKYTPAATEQVYARLLTHARSIHAAGYTPILDATYLTRAQRAPVLALARERRAPLVIHSCEAPLAVLHERLRNRQAAGGDPSEATEEVLDQLAERWEPFTPEELKCVPGAQPPRPL